MIQSEIAHIIKSQLEHQRLCILCTTGEQGMHAMPVRFRNSGLTLFCLVPRWADIEYFIEQNPDVFILVSFHMPEPVPAEELGFPPFPPEGNY